MSLASCYWCTGWLLKERDFRFLLQSSSVAGEEEVEKCGSRIRVGAEKAKVVAVDLYLMYSTVCRTL